MRRAILVPLAIVVVIFLGLAVLEIVAGMLNDVHLIAHWPG